MQMQIQLQLCPVLDGVRTIKVCCSALPITVRLNCLARAGRHGAKTLRGRFDYSGTSSALLGGGARGVRVRVLTRQSRTRTETSSRGPAP